MAAPPSTPPVGYMDHDRLGHMNFRLWQIVMAAITLAVTCWFCTMGIIPAIIILFMAKHVLVAVLAAGLHLTAPEPESPPLDCKQHI